MHGRLFQLMPHVILFSLQRLVRVLTITEASVRDRIYMAIQSLHSVHQQVRWFGTTRWCIMIFGTMILQRNRCWLTSRETTSQFLQLLWEQRWALSLSSTGKLVSRYFLLKKNQFLPLQFRERNHIPLSQFQFYLNHSGCKKLAWTMPGGSHQRTRRRHNSEFPVSPIKEFIRLRVMKVPSLLPATLEELIGQGCVMTRAPDQ